MEETNEAAPVAEETTAEVVTHTGTVVWFNYKTGFGYIKPDDKTINDGKDLFIHYKGISDNLAVTKEGKPPFKKLLRDQRVKFELGKNSKGLVAINVDKEDQPPQVPEEEVTEDAPTEVAEEPSAPVVDEGKEEAKVEESDESSAPETEEDQNGCSPDEAEEVSDGEVAEESSTPETDEAEEAPAEEKSEDQPAPEEPSTETSEAE